MKHVNFTLGPWLRRTTLGLLGAALAALTACGSADYEQPIVYQAPVQASVAEATVTLSTAQVAQVNTATAQIAAGNFGDALTGLSAVAAQLPNTSAEVQTAMGQAFAGLAGSNPSQLGQAAAQTRLGAGGTETVGITGALIEEASGAPGDSGAQAKFSAGQAALANLLPTGTAVGGLSTANQAQVGMVAVVQSMRLMNMVGDGQLSRGSTAANVDAALAEGYDATRQAELSRMATLVSQTKTPLMAELTRSAKGAADLANATAAVDRLSAAAADGTVSAAELKAFHAELAAR